MFRETARPVLLALLHFALSKKHRSCVRSTTSLRLLSSAADSTCWTRQLKEQKDLKLSAKSRRLKGAPKGLQKQYLPKAGLPRAVPAL